MMYVFDHTGLSPRLPAVTVPLFWGLLGAGFAYFVGVPLYAVAAIGFAVWGFAFVHGFGA